MVALHGAPGRTVVLEAVAWRVVGVEPPEVTAVPEAVEVLLLTSM
jgi:hypothetical protein